MKRNTVRRKWRLSLFVLVMLIIEYLDEFAYSALEVSRPLIRDAFSISYLEIGLITTIPVIVAIVIEPLIGLYADGRGRKPLMVAGGLLFGTGMAVQGLAPSFLIFLVGASLTAPASGAFVTIAQAALMDDAPARRENRMAMWTFSGSLAVVTGPLMLTLMLLFGASWRTFFVLTGILFIIVALIVLRLPANRALRTDDGGDLEAISAGDALRNAVDLLRSGTIWRWLGLLEFSNLMLDVLFSLLALYMVDVVGTTQAQAGIAIVVWTGIGLVGDFLLIPLLERVPGLRYLRFSAGVILLLYPAFLLVTVWPIKLALLGIIGLFNAGWYAILQGKLYDTLGEQSGAIMIVGNAAGIFGALLPVMLGALAEQFGLGATMWVLLIAPVVLLIGLPRADTVATNE